MRLAIENYWHPRHLWFLLQVSPNYMQSVNLRRGLRLAFLCLATAMTGNLWSQSEPNTRTAADSVITFNEIMYHPAGDDPKAEWVELYNQMSINMDISKWRITGAIDFQFP